jgi:hypothetical protein
MSKPPPTTDEIRSAIDDGRTGEKVAFPDPAAVPLGTDSEAGGNPPTPEERAMDVRAQVWFPAPHELSGLLVYALFAGAAVILVLAFAMIAG